MDDPPPETQVGRINLIVERICMHLTPKDLLAARLVCKLWLEEATKSAVKQQCLKANVPLKDGAEAVQEFARLTESSTFPTSAFQWDLTKLGEMIRPSERLQVYSLALGRDPPQESESFSHWQTAMQTVLKKTKCLILASTKGSFVDDLTCLFWNALGENTHIQELHYGVYGKRRYPVAINQPSLPNLHTVVVHPAETGDDLNDLERILKGAPNLKTFSGCTPRFLRMVRRAGKVACVKKLDLPMLGSSNVDVLRFCMAAGFKFEEVSFELVKPPPIRHRDDVVLLNPMREMRLDPEVLVAELVDDWVDLADVVVPEAFAVNMNPVDHLERTLGAFLVFNRLTLKCLKAPNLHAVNAVLTEDVKRFMTLKKLYLHDPKNINHKNADEIPRAKALLPVGVDLGFVFPVLETVVLDLKALVPAYLEMYFPDDDLSPGGNIHPIPSVKTLIIKCRFDADGMVFLARKFPNLKHVTIYQVIGSYAHGLSSAVWNLPEELQTVTFHFRIKHLHLKIKKLDDLLLGLRKDEYPPLEESMKLGTLNVNVLKNTRYMRVQRVAITRLKKLKELKIILDTDKDLQPLKRSIRKSPDAEKIKEKKKENNFFVHSGIISPVCALLSTELMKKTKFVLEYDGKGKYSNGILKRLKHLKPYFEFDGALKSYDYTDD